VLPVSDSNVDNSSPVATTVSATKKSTKKLTKTRKIQLIELKSEKVKKIGTKKLKSTLDCQQNYLFHCMHRNTCNTQTHELQ